MLIVLSYPFSEYTFTAAEYDSTEVSKSVEPTMSIIL